MLNRGLFRIFLEMMKLTKLDLDRSMIMKRDRLIEEI